MRSFFFSFFTFFFFKCLEHFRCFATALFCNIGFFMTLIECGSAFSRPVGILLLFHLIIFKNQILLYLTFHKNRAKIKN